MTSTTTTIQSSGLTRQPDTTHKDTEQELHTFPLKDVVMWVSKGAKLPPSETTPGTTYESLSKALAVAFATDDGYEVDESEDDDSDIDRSQENEAEQGYEGDNDCDDTDNRSVDTTDSLVLAAERLPHLLCHPQHFEPLKEKASRSTRIPRRRGGRVSCVPRRKTSPHRLSLQEDLHLLPRRKATRANRLSLQEDLLPSRAKVPVVLPALQSRSFKHLWCQDSLPLNHERLDHEHQVISDDDDSFFQEEIVESFDETPPEGGSDNSFHSPRAIISTKSHDAFVQQKRGAHESEKTSSKSPIRFPSLRVVKKEGFKVAFKSFSH